MVRESKDLPNRLSEDRDRLTLVSDFEPAGDQATAIAGLIEGLDDGLARQTLLGVTGSGKTFTVASIIENSQRPAMILAPNKTLAAQLYGEMREFFPNNAVEYFVSYYDYYQPEAYVPSSDTYIEKDASINQHIEQMRLSATKALIERPDVIIVATVSAIYGLGDPEAYFSMVLHLARGDELISARCCGALRNCSTHATRWISRREPTGSGATSSMFSRLNRSAMPFASSCSMMKSSHCLFRPADRRGCTPRARLTIFPKSHYVTPRERLLEACEHIKVELKDV